MKTLDEATGMDPQVKSSLQETCDRVVNGPPFTREEKDAAMKRMDRLREEIRKLHGIQNIAVDLIREARDSR
jgi:hypothetical protein